MTIDLHLEEIQLKECAFQELHVAIEMCAFMKKKRK